MRPATLKALKGSIRKWEGIVAGDVADEGPDNCPLCGLFYDNHPACDGCPVMEASGHSGCFGTPYVAWSRAVAGMHYVLPWKASTAGLKKLAKNELNFLEGLLPKKRGKAATK